MSHRRGIIIHPDELEWSWVERLQEAHLNVLALHPPGGANAHITLENAVHHRLLPQTQAIFDHLYRMGVGIEYEAHAMGWLLPRWLFAVKPEWFRMDENGKRIADYNLCPSNPEALDYVAARAQQLARLLDVESDRYFFWLDDVSACACHCEKCRSLSVSDQQLITVNAMLRGIRRYKASAKLSYLAYHDAIAAPQKTEPINGVFLEYAPFHRNAHRPLLDPDCPENVQEAQSLSPLLSYFGTQDSQVLEYWMDNSLYSKWTKPPRQFQLDEAVMEQDVKAYREMGFASITSFGCFLGQDYRELWGEPPVRRYGEILLGNE